MVFCSVGRCRVETFDAGTPEQSPAGVAGLCPACGMPGECVDVVPSDDDGSIFETASEGEVTA